MQVVVVGGYVVFTRGSVGVGEGNACEGLVVGVSVAECLFDLLGLLALEGFGLLGLLDCCFAGLLILPDGAHSGVGEHERDGEHECCCEAAHGCCLHGSDTLPALTLPYKEYHLSRVFQINYCCLSRVV